MARRYITVDVEVDVDIQEFETKDLIAELERRSIDLPYMVSGIDAKAELDEIYMQYVRGQADQATQSMKRFIELATGKTIP